MARRKKPIYSRDLGIDLGSGRERELFKWFLACLLFGKPIQLVREGLVTPPAILQAGWDKLVEVLDRGHYVRYDFSTATKLLDVCEALLAGYGSLVSVLRRSKSEADLARRLQEFKGIGQTTTRIFLRDLRSAGPRREHVGPPRADRGGRRRSRRTATRSRKSPSESRHGQPGRLWKPA